MDSEREQVKPQWFWCARHGDFAVRPVCPTCEQDGQAFTATATVSPSPAEAQDGVGLIAAERRRHRAQEGWTPEHDDTHDDGSLAGAGACLATEGTDGEFLWVNYDSSWIRQLRDKHAATPRIRQLAIAGALIAAEIDRLQRALAASTGQETPHE